MMIDNDDKANQDVQRKKTKTNNQRTKKSVNMKIKK